MITPAAPTSRWSDGWLWEAAARVDASVAALAAAAPRDSAWESLLAAGASEAAVLGWAERASGTSAASLDRIGPSVAPLLPASMARRYGVVPLGVIGPTLEVAASDPLRAALEQELAFAAGRTVIVRVASPASIAAAIAAVYDAPRAESIATPRAPAAPPSGPATARPAPPPPHGFSSAGAADGESATGVVDRLIAEALKAGASDVHVEPRATDLLVRFRVDGALYDAATVPGRLAGTVTSRLKVLAGLDIADRIRPQDGRATVTHEGRAVDLRVSTLPIGSGGEKVVVRLLDSKTAAHDLAELGFSAGELHRVRRLLALTEGMVLVTGPTGSGKTTTLYSALRHVQSRETNVVTVEDPIEYRFGGISQVQVNEKAGLTFASALRSILRQDPDVVLVGEIRDQETAAIAVKASMTGHLVLSTLHTNDAPSAVARLIDIGAEPGALAGAIKGVVAQRLVRRLCTTCSAPLAAADLPPDQQPLLAGKATTNLRTAVGCAECRGTGYRGRMTVAEVMIVSPEMQRAIARGADLGEVAALAARQGMHTLWESGLSRVIAGTTSLHELLDNLTPPVPDEATQPDVETLVSALRSTAAPAPVTDASAAPGVRPRRFTGSQTRVGATVRVLVVDDDRAARSTMREALERAGAVVIEAADGEAALAYARRLAPDAIICDLALPRLDGIGLLQALRADGSGVRVHVATDQRDAELLQWARELGAAGVHDGDFDARALVASLRPVAHSAA